ncbi:hypothetical protein O181_083617 [Austropuccinia psidii MF-1]|uniref:Reverse transcriptase Ty1/copia-type domain-containing protein n=1 Tax=Austropuccinia psidii MF-1 TaxID=1389203 RepID=A0A9Q3FUR6_9BASI|nr:hypothetical protein [Austropuccinia psidii MF-1]
MVIKSASVTFDESVSFLADKHAHIKSIQTSNLFDDSMICKIKRQEELIDKSSKTLNTDLTIPMTYREAMTSTESFEWSSAIQEEMNSMEEEVFIMKNLNDDLKEVPREIILSTKWVFVWKPERFKARLVAQGFRQIHGINHKETFVPTPTFSALKLLFSITVTNNWPIKTFDVKVAFIHSIIDKPVYVWPPQGMNVPKYQVLKLHKALYGTKQANRCWWIHLKEILQKVGFTANSEDPSTYNFQKDGQNVILWIHVDDGVLMALSTETLHWITAQLNAHLKIKWDTIIKGLVGISIEETAEGFKFSQPDLITKLVDLNASNITAKSPLPPNCKLESNLSLNDMDKPYLRRIGMLLYIAQASRPDISYAVNYLAHFSMNTTQHHWDALENLTAYLRGTMYDGILIRKHQDIQQMTSWQSRRQTTVASSTAQAKYMALSFAARETLWIYNLFCKTIATKTPILLSNNKTAVGISTDSMSKKQTRHLIREFNVINEYIVMKKLELKWATTNEQLADIMTKPLGNLKTQQFRQRMSLK